MPFSPNDGGRPSRLDLARQLTGELPRDASPELDALEAEVASARAVLPPFDPELLRAAAARQEEAERRGQRPATAVQRVRWWRSWFTALVPALACALALYALRAPEDAGNRLKGGVDLDFYVLQGAEVKPGVEGEVLAAGDRVQFTYRAAGHDTLVLVGVDGEGAVSLYYPERGDAPEAVEPWDRRVLEGSIELDDAAGPEVFVALFSVESASEGLELVEEIYAEGGWGAVVRWAKDAPDADALVVEKAH